MFGLFFKDQIFFEGHRARNDRKSENKFRQNNFLKQVAEIYAKK